jgi:hypothetical protein
LVPGVAASLHHRHQVTLERAKGEIRYSGPAVREPPARINTYVSRIGVTEIAISLMRRRRL